MKSMLSRVDNINCRNPLYINSELKNLYISDGDTVYYFQGPREEVANDFVRFICNNIDQFHDESSGIHEVTYINSIEKVGTVHFVTFYNHYNEILIAFVTWKFSNQ